MAKGLANDEGGLIPLVARASAPFASIEDLWRRRPACRSRPSNAWPRPTRSARLGVNRRDALWTIKGLSDAPLPLFAAADEREGRSVPEVVEPDVSLDADDGGREVVEDYRSKGLTLRQHPVAFLRQELERRRMIPARICSRPATAGGSRSPGWCSCARSRARPRA